MFGSTLGTIQSYDYDGKLANKSHSCDILKFMIKISIPSWLISFKNDYVILTWPFRKAIYLSSKSYKAHKIFFNFAIGTLFLKIIFSSTRRKQQKCHHKRFQWMRKRQLSLNYTDDVFFKTFALLSERSWQSSLLNLLPVPGAVWEDMFLWRRRAVHLGRLEPTSGKVL